MRKLLFKITAKDCKFETFTAGGKGGQHQNRSQTGVRWIHPPSGAAGECRETRSQLTNKRRAWRRMAEHPKFKLWQRLQAARIMGQPSIEEQVDEAMATKNLKIEVKQNSKWVHLQESL